METFNEFDTKGTIPSRNTGDIITHTFENYKSIFLYVIAAMVLYLILSMIVQPLSGFDQNALLEDAKSNPGSFGMSNYLAAPGFKSYTGLSFVFGLLLTPLFASIIYMAHKANTKQEISFGDLFFAYKNRFLNIVIFAFISNIILTISLMMCVLPAIFIMPLIFLGYPIIIFENASATQALSKAFNLAKENYGTFLGVSFLSILISFAGIVLCFVGVLATALFAIAASYSLYVAYVGLPKQIEYKP